VLWGGLGALYSKVGSYCGMVWRVEVLHRIVKLCPVKHCVAGLGIIRHGFELRGSVERCLVRLVMVRLAKASLRHGIVWRSTVESGFARLRAVGQASALFGLGVVRWSPVRLGMVSLSFHGYGGYQK